MKKLLLKTMLLLCALVAGSSNVWGDSETITFSQLGLTNGVQYTDPFGTNISVTFGGGSNDGKYYDTGTGIRTYGGGTITITAKGNTITNIATTFSGASNAPADESIWSPGTGTTGVSASWSGSATEVVMTRPSGGGHWRLQSITVTYATGGTPTCANPTFTPGTGVYSSTQSVTLSCETDGATIYYTTNGTDPTTSSSTYSSAISVSSTTTIKAMATATGYNNSSVATSTYTIVEHAGTEEDPYTVADARTAIDAGTGVTGVYATGIVSAIVTAYNSDYSNITFDISSDGSTGSAQLRAYRCVGATGVDASDVQVGDIVKISGGLTKYNDTYEFTQGCELVSLEHPVVTTPTITVGTSALSGFTYETGNGPSAAQSFTVSGSNLTANISLSLGESDFEMSLSEGSGYTNTLTLTPEAGNVSETTIFVRLKEGLAVNTYNGTITLTSTGATNKTVSLSGSVTAPEAANVTWDLRTNSYDANPTENLVTWSSSYATMTNAKGTSSNAANNYLGGDSNNRTSSRFYSNNILTITPASGYAITSVVFTATSTNYANALQGSTWTNASASVDGTTVTVTPTSGASAFSAAIGGTCGFTEVKVYYEEDNTPAIAVSSTSIDANCTQTEGTITVTYTNIADNSSAAVYFCDSEGASASYDWITATINGSKNVAYTISANSSTERTAYMKVKVGDVYSPLITFTQAAYVEAAYYLATSITSGKHYVIASGTNGAVSVMSTQNTNNRTVVAGSVSGTGLSFEAGVEPAEFVIYGPDADGYYTIYDGTGYLYAASSTANQLKTQETNDDNGRWSITFNESVASIVATESSNRNVMQYNSSSSIFACYASDSQSDVYLYEKANEATPTESKTLNSYGYATYASQNALDFTSNSDVTAWAVTEISGTTITFSQITGKVPAGTGMLLMGEASANVTLTSATGKDDLGTNLLEGITSATTVADNAYYGLSGNEFVPVTAGTVPAGKALLPANLVNNARSLSMVFEGVDGINEIVNGKSVNGTCYDLSGRRVVKPTKGLYIVNGKKIVK